MYARPQYVLMRRVFCGSAVMRRFTACVALTATQAPSQTLRPTHTYVCTRRCHTQSGQSSGPTSSKGHPSALQPHLLLAVTRTVLELWPHVCNEVIRKYETSAGRLMVTSDVGSEDIARSMLLVEEVQKGVFRFDKSKGCLSLIRKESNNVALMTASIEGVLIVFVHASVAAVDFSRAPSIQQIPAPPPPPGCGAQPPWRIYCVPNFTADHQDVIKAFLFALNSEHKSPFKIIKEFPDDRKLAVWQGSQKATVHVAACKEDWAGFHNRHCDFLHSGMCTSASTVPEGGRSFTASSEQPVLYDYAVDPEWRLYQRPPHLNNLSTTKTKPRFDPVVFTVDEQLVQLFCGESGIGKTVMMLIGRCMMVDLVVYVCTATKAEVVQWNDSLARRRQSGAREINHEAERCKFIELLATLVKDAVGQELHESLCLYESAFRVRLVFDDVSSLGEVVRALCRGLSTLRDALQWGRGVRLYVVAGGTGIRTTHGVWSSIPEWFRLTRLGPESAGVLWERMKESVTSKAKAHGAHFHAALTKVLHEVSTDVVGKSACCNPRLAALMIVRCWNVTTVAGDWHLVQQISSGDIWHRILVPVAGKFQSLTELSDVGGHVEFCELLVSALCYALFAGFSDTRRSGDLLSQKYGVLVDNACVKYRSTVFPQCETIALDDGGREVEVRGTGGVVCYPTAKGHYSISPAMMVVLQLLHAAHVPHLVRCEGALAHMLYIAVQVYQGRPVVELLRFVFGEDAVSTSITTSLEGKAVAYKTVALRCHRTDLNEDTVVALPETADDAPKHPAAGAKATTRDAAHAAESCHQEESCEGSIVETPTVGTRASTAQVPLGETSALGSEQQTHSAALWSTSCEVGAAWVEVSPAALPSAGVVLHIPGVLTLPVACKDVGVALLLGEIEAELDAMVRRVEKTKGQQAEKPAPPQSAADLKFVDKLAELGGVVVPVLCYTRSGLAAEHRTMKSAVHDFARVIFADGLGEDVSDEADPRRRHLHDARLVRRSMFPFTLRQVQAEWEVGIVDACPAR